MAEATVETHERPWEQLQTLIEQDDSSAVEQFIHALPVEDIAITVSRLDAPDRERLVEALTPEAAAEVIEHLPTVQAAELIEGMAPPQAARVLDELPSDDRTDLLHEMDEEAAQAVIASMGPVEAGEVQALIAYPDDQAGGLMIREFLAYPNTATVGEVVDDLRRHADEYSDYDVQYVYVVDPRERLVGVLRLRDLLLSPGSMPIRELMIPDPLTVPDTETLDELRHFFEAHEFFGVPAVDAQGRLVGVVRRSAVEEALADRSDEDFRKTQGIVGGEEMRSMPTWLRSRRRLSWLIVNIVLNVIAASVIALYEDTLQAVIALAVFLPIVSDMSGSAGGQAVAVSLRELALDLVRPAEVLRVLGKEVAVGAINGLILGVLIGTVAWLWKGNVFLGLVIGAALCLNTVVSVAIGGTLPLVLKRLNWDPALSSTLILTTITDMCGFFLTLSFAAMMLKYL